MQRNWELVRTILLKMEEQPESAGHLPAESVTTFDKDTVVAHMLLLDQAGLIKTRSLIAGGAVECVALSMTWEGHNFLDKIRKDSVWNKTKTMIKEKGLDLSVEAIKLAGAKVIESMF